MSDSQFSSIIHRCSSLRQVAWSVLSLFNFLLQFLVF